MLLARGVGKQPFLIKPGVPAVAQWVKNPTSIHEGTGLTPALAQWIRGSSVATSCGIDNSCGLDLVLLWLWHRQLQLQFNPKPGNFHMPQVRP